MPNSWQSFLLSRLQSRHVQRKCSVRKAVALRSPPRRRIKQPAHVAGVASHSIYSVHPGIAMLRRWVAELAAKTGRSLDEWLRHIQQSGPKTEKECRTWLSEKYQLGTNSAGWLAEKAFGDAADLANDTPAGYLAVCARLCRADVRGIQGGAQADSRRAGAAARALVGSDVRVCPCKTMVPLYRKHVFAQIKPATQRRNRFGAGAGR